MATKNSTNSTATLTEMNYLSGVTSAIQTQLDAKQPLDSDLTAIAGLTATTDNFIQSKSSAWASRTVAQVKTDLGVISDYLMIQDQKTANTAGGSSVATTWNTRTLNTAVVNGITGASLASNQITLPAGTYYVKARCPGFIVSKQKSRLRNVTDSTTAIVGSSSYTDSGDAVQTDTTIMGTFTIASQKVFELQHYTELTRATNGFGVPTNATEVEVYSEIEIWKKS